MLWRQKSLSVAEPAVAEAPSADVDMTEEAVVNAEAAAAAETGVAEGPATPEEAAGAEPAVEAEAEADPDDGTTTPEIAGDAD